MHCKPLTVSHYGLMLRKHIVPALGELLVSEVERKHIMAFQYGLRDMPTVANRTVDILVKMFNLAGAWGWRPSGRNPCRFVRRYKVEKHHERFLTPEKLYRLGRALDAAPERCERKTDNGEVEQRNDLQAYGRRAPCGRTGGGVLGSGAFGLRGAGLSIGIKGLPWCRHGPAGSRGGLPSGGTGWCRRSKRGARRRW